MYFLSNFGGWSIKYWTKFSLHNIAAPMDKNCENESKNHMTSKNSLFKPISDKIGLFIFFGTPCEGKIGCTRLQYTFLDQWNTFCVMNFFSKPCNMILHHNQITSGVLCWWFFLLIVIVATTSN